MLKQRAVGKGRPPAAGPAAAAQPATAAGPAAAAERATSSVRAALAAGGRAAVGRADASILRLRSAGERPVWEIRNARARWRKKARARVGGKKQNASIRRAPASMASAVSLSEGSSSEPVGLRRPHEVRPICDKNGSTETAASASAASAAAGQEKEKGRAAPPRAAARGAQCPGTAAGALCSKPVNGRVATAHTARCASCCPNCLNAKTPRGGRPDASAGRPTHPGGDALWNVNGVRPGRVWRGFLGCAEHENQ